MSYADLIRRAWKHNVLFSVLLELTYRCNLNCYYCYNDRGLQGRPLSREQYFRLFAGLRDMGVLHLIFSGGEPLMHPDFFTLGAKARELGFVLRIKSNGHGLDRETASRIKTEIDPFIIDISLHGASAIVHDRQTRVPGSFERLLHNLDFLVEKQRIRLNATLTAWNEPEIEAMFALAHGYGLPLNMNLTISPCDSGGTDPLSIIASDRGVARTLELVQKQAAEMAGKQEGGREAFIDCDAEPGDGEKICGSGASTLAVDPFGNVLPCVQWRKSAGSLHDLSIREIHESSELLRKVREITRQAGGMMRQQWPGLGGLGYCPALSGVLAGDPLGQHPQSTRLMRAVQSKLNR